jgi:hypothetical protein
MLTDDACGKVRRYNEYCLHYNLVADACYRMRSELKNPFTDSYFPYLVAALISFDMGRQMGKGTKSKYDPSANGFATRLKGKLNEISAILSPFINENILNIELSRNAELIKKAYDKLADDQNGLHSSSKCFHVGATKILHFLAPNLFPIVDSNAAKVFRDEFQIAYRNTTQPGYCSERYFEVMERARNTIRSYGEDNFRALEHGTPIMRVLDKIVFAHVGGWDEEIA